MKLITVVIVAHIVNSLRDATITSIRPVKDTILPEIKPTVTQDSEVILINNNRLGFRIYRLRYISFVRAFVRTSHLIDQMGKELS